GEVGLAVCGLTSDCQAASGKTRTAQSRHFLVAFAQLPPNTTNPCESSHDTPSSPPVPEDLSMIRFRLGAALLAVCALASTSWLVGADDKKPDEKKPDDPPKAKGVLPQNWKQLGLTKDQVTEVYKVQSKFNSEIDKLKAKIDALKAEEKVELEKILTDEQKRK